MDHLLLMGGPGAAARAPSWALLLAYSTRFAAPAPQLLPPDAADPLTPRSFPFHLAAPPAPFTSTCADGAEVSGHAHLGALRASAWLASELRAPLEAALEAHEGYGLAVTGHSLGAACAALLAIRWGWGRAARRHWQRCPIPRPPVATRCPS